VFFRSRWNALADGCRRGGQQSQTNETKTLSAAWAKTICGEVGQEEVKEEEKQKVRWENWIGRVSDAITPDGKSVWFIEKIYSNDTRGIQPGIYKLDLKAADFQRRKDKDPPFYSADRLADFPIRNVTGMAFSPDGRRLIVRNYLNAHVFTRPEGRTWAEVVASVKPTPVVMPIQSQGEAICFTRDSKSVLITSEFKRSTIWKVDLPAAENQVK